MNLHFHDTLSPSILCVHGFPFDHTMWLPLADELRGDFRMILPDLRGMGRSPCEAGNTVTMRELADDLAKLLDTLGVEKCVFCGLSMGGYVGWEFWQHHADRLLGIILCDSNAGCDTPEAAETRRKTAERVLAEGPGFLADGMMERILAPETVAHRPEIVAHYRRMVTENNPQGVAAVARGMAQRRDFREDVKHLTLPVLILSGEHDVLSPPAAMRTLAESMPNAVYTPIAGAGHLAPLENFVKTAEVIRAFWK